MKGGKYKGGKEGRGTGSGRERGEEQKGKLVHAMIMVVNHKATICCKKKKKVNIAKQIKKPSHQNTGSTKYCCHCNAFEAYQSP